MGMCYYCGVKTTRTQGPLRKTADHFWPVSRPHSYPRTLRQPIKVPACFQCNQVKGRMLPLEWFHFMQGNIGWRDLRRKRRTRQIRLAEQQAAFCMTDRYSPTPTPQEPAAHE